MLEDATLCPQSEPQNDNPPPGVVSLDRARDLRDKFGLLDPEDLADMIGIDTRTLAAWRAQKRGPDAVRAGRAIFYRRDDVLAWLALNVVPMDRVA
jgi:hypothetical protein